jgi:hypothetical protein
LQVLFWTLIHLKIYPNIDKYLWNLLVKFQLDPTVEFGVMLNRIKLDGRNFYTKIQIWPCFGRITRLNRIIYDSCILQFLNELNLTYRRLTSFVASFYFIPIVLVPWSRFHCVTLLSDLFRLSKIRSQSWLWVAWPRDHEVRISWYQS